MATQLQDAKLKITLEVGGAERGAKGLRKKRERESREEERFARRAGREKQRLLRGGNLRGAAGDVLRGRLPGAGRFGGTATKAAAALATAYALTELGPPLLGAMSGLTGGLSDKLPGVAATKEAIAWLDKRLAWLESLTTAWGITREDIAGSIVAGRTPNLSDEAAFFRKQQRLADLNLTAERANRRLSKELIGQVVAEVGKDAVLDWMIEAATDASSSDKTIAEKLLAHLRAAFPFAGWPKILDALEGAAGSNPAGNAGRQYR